MLGFKSLIAIVAVASMVTASIVQAGDASGRKHDKQPTIFSSEKARGSHAEMPPAWSYQGTRGLSSPAGRG